MATMADAKRRLTIEHVSIGAEQAAADLKKVAAAHDGVAVASERSERAQQSMERRLETVQRRYDEVYRSQQALAQVDRTLANAQQQGLITMQRRLELLSMAAERHGLATAAINREIAATERLADVQRMQVAANQNSPMGGFARHNMNNAAFQIQDIAMMAALGQAPVATALQQGPQLAMALEAGGGLRALGAGLASLVSPMMLLTVGITGATAAAIQFFTTWVKGSKDTEEALKKQNELIASVAARWGDALPALRDYNDEIQRQKDLSDALEATTAARSQQYIEERGAVVTLTADLDDLVNRLQAFGASPTGIVVLQDAFGTLEERVAASTATAADAEAVQKALNDLFAQTGLPIVGEYAAKFGELAKQIDASSKAAEKFDVIQRGSSLFNAEGLESFLGALDPLNGFRRTPFQTEEEIMFARNRPASTPVGATGTMTNVNGVNVHTYMSDTAEHTEASAEFLDAIDQGLPEYFDRLNDTLENDVTGSITKWLQQLVYSQDLAAMSISEAVRSGLGIVSGSYGGKTYTSTGARGDIRQTLFDPNKHLQSGTLAYEALASGGLRTNYYAGMFAEGGEWTVPGSNWHGDRNLVSLHANSGETIHVKTAQGGSGGAKEFHLHYTPAPGDSESTTQQRMRTAFREMMFEARRE